MASGTPGPGRPRGSVDKKPRRRGKVALGEADAAIVRGRMQDRAAIERLKKNPPGWPSKDRPKGAAAKKVQKVIDRVATMEAETREVLKLLPPLDVDHQRLLDMRASGMTRDQIATELGWAPSTVSYRLVDALGQLHGEIVRDVDSARTIALLRLERLIQASWPAAMEGGTEAVGNVLKILAQQSKYLGLDAPQRVDVTFYIKQMAQEYGLDEAELEAEFLKIRPELPPG